MGKFKEIIIANTVGTKSIVVEKITYHYNIVKKSVAPELPNFVGIIDGLLFISEETPIEFRKYILTHEIFCNIILQKRSGRCLCSLKKELELIPTDLRDSYIQFRMKFFETLVDYSKESNDDIFKKEIQASLAHLQQISSK